MSRCLVIAWLSCAWLLAGCASGLRVEVLESFDTSEREIVLLSQSQWDPEIRRTLGHRGIVVKRFPSTRTLERDISPSERERFRDAAARYGLTVYFSPIIDRCLVNENVKYGKITYEVTDLRRNAVIATVAQGGGTGPCAWHRDNVFDDLAEALDSVWRRGRSQ